jgi:hypothetical protein
MPRPVLLDLFCGGGGAAAGYARAGFNVVGVDLRPQPFYPFPFLFHQLDALHFLRNWLRWRDKTGHTYAAVHASPPCQHHSNLAAGTNGNRHDYPELIEKTRDLLIESGVPYVIENVVGAPLRDPVRLCGEMFGLDVIRHRLFETNWPLTAPPHPKHRGRVAGCRHGEWFEGPYVAVYGDGGGKGTIAQWQRAMGIDWITSKKTMAEAIPPAYTEFIGRQLMAELKVDHLEGTPR